MTSDPSQQGDGGLWGRETRLPTLTPANGRPQQPPTVYVAMTRGQRGDAVWLRNQIALQQMQAAAADRREDEREHEYVNVRVQWAETTRYEADLYIDPWSSEDVIWSELANLPDGQRRTLDLVESDNRIVSVVDLDGDGHIDAYEMSISAGNVITDWGDAADRVDESIAESPSWSQLNAALTSAAAAGYDVETGLALLATLAPLPAHDPAGELYHRLLSSGAAEVAGDSGAGARQPLPRRDEQPGYGAEAPHISAPAI